MEEISDIPTEVFKFNKCDSEFCYKSVLKAHMTLKHPDQQEAPNDTDKFTCEHCKFEMNLKYNLMRHQKREYEC